MKFVCVIPAYKPDFELISLAKKLIERDLLCVVVNDGSGKEYDSIFSQLPAQVILLAHAENKGKGQAIRTALAYISESLTDVFGIITADADGQHSIEAILEAKEQLIKYPNALILGSRRFDNKTVPLRSRLGNFITRNIFALANRKYVYDTQTGLRAFSTSRINDFLQIKGNRYEFEMNMLIQAARNGTNIREFYIQTIYLDHNRSSHFNPFKDSIKIITCIAKYSLSSFLCFLLDIGLFSLLAHYTIALGQTQSIIISEVIARCISSTLNFFLNKTFVFSGNESTGKAFIKYAILVIFTLCADALLVLLMVELNINKTLAKIIAGAILFCVNYLVQSRVVFKTRKEE